MEILLSIRPEWVARILSGEKTIEVRKKFPKDYQGWVYIYCTKNLKSAKQCLIVKDSLKKFIKETDITYYGKPILGKVVARFWCDKVEELICDTFNYTYSTETLSVGEFRVKSCLLDGQLYDYLEHNNGYAIHISKLEIFDKPKELSEFKVYNKYANPYLMNLYIPLTKAPSNYCYVEVE